MAEQIQIQIHWVCYLALVNACYDLYDDDENTEGDDDGNTTEKL